MARIFLCHANEDKPRVETLYDRLLALGFEPWMDKRDLIPGQRWQWEIPRALKASALVLICLSHNIGGSGYLQREFKLALDALQEIPEDMIHTIPVRLDPCNVPDQFSELHWCNLFEPNGFDVLVSAIRYGLAQRGELIPELKASTLPHTFTNSIGMEFMLIPARTFMMGSPDSDTEAYDDEKPAHRVTFTQPFYLGKYPVTQAQWEAVMDNNPSRFKGSNHPVESVSWDGVQAFIHKLNEREGGGDYRLPTEAQWEYACRAGTEASRYHQDIDAIAWYEANSSGQTHPVGQKLSNTWGLYDMLGNVFEWCHDGRRTYVSVSVTDPMGSTAAGAKRVYRGGSWSVGARRVRAAFSSGSYSDYRDDDVGFRCLSSGPSR